PSAASTGKPITVSWTHVGNPSLSYGYALTYSCSEGVTFDAPLPNDTTTEVPCDQPFNYTNAKSSMTITPRIKSGSNGGSVTITISSMNLSNGQTTARGSGVI